MPRNKYPEETVQKILDVSLKLFLEKGYEQTTILDIVDNLGGLTRGAFYHHFKSKEEVLEALADREFHENNPFDAVKADAGANGLQKIKNILLLQIETDKQYADLHSPLLSLMENPRFLAKRLEDSHTIATDYLQPLIEEGIADGSIAGDRSRAKHLAEISMLLLNFWLFHFGKPVGVKERIQRLTFLKDVLDRLGFPIMDEEVFAEVRTLIKDSKID